MFKMSDNPLASSFMMLTNRLHDLFVQYILENRTRAPPEFELGEMLPTFQLGAKTDRRALQSKFKCWAKRMKYENGYLVLGNSGKIIVPRDKCDNIIMCLHSEKHNNVEYVILQIQMRYSWTKKNFGMDRDLVVQSIAKNCKRKGCLEEMRTELSRLNSNFCKLTKSSPSLVPFPMLTTESDFNISTPMPHSSYLCRWPLPFPAASMFPSNAMPFGTPCWNYSLTPVTSATPSTFPNGSMLPKQHNSDTENNVPSLKFKQPTNALEYETLMKVVRQNPNIFPKILGNKKTLFLSNFGIAPKSICSLPTLKRFREEIKSKKYLNRDCMIYKERKILRDRSKLKKFFQERRPYLEMPKNRGRISSCANKAANLRSPSKKLNTSNSCRNINNGRRFEDNYRKGITSCVMTRNKQIEVIDIVSSDEEERKENLPPDKAIEIENMPTNANQNAKEEAFQVSDSNDGQSFNVHIKSSPDPEENRVHQLSKADNCYVKPTICYPFPLVHSIPLKLFPPSNLCSTSVSQSKDIKYPLKNKLNAFNIPKIGNQQTQKVVRPYILPRANFAGKGPISLHLRQKSSSIEQLHPYFALSNRNVPRFVCPVPIPKMVSNSADKDRNRRILATPLFPNFTRKSNCRIAPATTPSSVSITVPCSPSTVSQLDQTSKSTYEAQHQPQTNIVSKNRKKGIKSKLDINEEMMRISKWIYRMKGVLNPNMFQSSVEKSVQKLVAQLDYGIQLVREARKCLSEVEEEAEFKEFIFGKINDLF